MAPSPAQHLLRALLSGVTAPAPARPAVAVTRILSQPLYQGNVRRMHTFWRHTLLRSFSSGRNGDDDGRSDNYGEDTRLFGEGGLFGSGPRRRTSDDWEEEEEEQPPQLSSEFPDAESWTLEEPQPAEGVSAEYTTEYQEGREGVATAPVEETRTYTWEAGAPDQEWAPKGAGLIGEWSSDGRLLKAGAKPPQADDAAFGDLIRKFGYTHDDIANLIGGFYEPVKLPSLDEMKFADVEGERKKQRRDLELAKMEEIAKRWVRKVDQNGFAHGVGRRKSSSARVWIREGEGRIVINKKYHDLYFTLMDHRVQYLEPFLVTDTMGMFDAFVLVKGGGVSGQAGAIRLGVSRALMWYDPSLRGLLKRAGMLTRDSRIVERKKPGRAKARRSFQWVKR